MAPSCDWWKITLTHNGTQGADRKAAIAVFLACEDSSDVTGETIYPDGGRMTLNDTVPVVE